MDVEVLNKLLETPPIPPNTSVLFPFETSIKHEDLSTWCRTYHYVPYLISLTYVCMVFGIQEYMKNKKPYNLKLFLVVWNGTLAVLSVIGFVRVIPELISVLRSNGFIYSICIPSYFKWDVSSFWVGLFAILKFPELGDTLFLALRKKRVIFLHWYHHATVLPFCWYGIYNDLGGARYFVAMNYFVHSFMYTYYALQSLKISIPLSLTIMLTFFQLLQMCFGFYISAYAYILKKRGITCLYTDGCIKFGLVIYFSYLVLFGNFFYQTYINKPKRTKKKN